jgi:hypothetical protein
MKQLWTEKRIKVGFEKFIDCNGKIPTASEVDAFEHLPSSRYIQKRFGGLEALRTELGYTDIHLGKGDFRSRIAMEAGARGRQIEDDFEIELHSIFTGECVQSEKTFSGKKRVDFYIKTPKGAFGIDIFYAQTMRTLQSSVNIKMKKYQEFTEPLYLTVANPAITQAQLDNYLVNKKNPLPDSIHLMSYKTLHTRLKTIQETLKQP